MKTDNIPVIRRSQFNIKWLLATVALFAVTFAFVRVVQQVLEVPDDAYAMLAAGDILLAYMSANKTTWPDSWESLEDFHARSGGKSTMAGPFTSMQSRIRIDFTFDPNTAMLSIARDDIAPTFRIVTLKAGGDTHWSGMEPNQRVFDYLKQTKFPQTAL